MDEFELRLHQLGVASAARSLNVVPAKGGVKYRSNDPMDGGHGLDGGGQGAEGFVIPRHRVVTSVAFKLCWSQIWRIVTRQSPG